MNRKFINLISKIKEPEIFLGICRILKVKVMDGEEPKDFSVLLEAAPRKRRRELLAIMREAIE